MATWLPPAAVTVITILAFIPSLSNGFVNWDDGLNFVDNRHYRGLGLRNLTWMFTTFHAGPYQPLSWITLGLDYTIWGMDARGYHLTSLLIHAAAAPAFYVLALRVLRLIAGRPDGRGETDLRFAAAVSALLFSIHPLRVESVAWATERRDVVSGVFFILTLLAYLRAQASRDDPRSYRTWLGLSLLAYLASLLGKGMGVTLPLVLIILDAYPLRRLGGGRGTWFGPAARSVWLEKAPFVLLAVIAGVVGIYGQITTGAVADMALYGYERRIGVATFATAFYLYKTILPLALSPLYPMPRSLSLLSWPYVLCIGTLLTLTLAAVYARRRWPAGLALWLSYLVMLAPVSGLTQMGPQIAADRYTYLPCLGWALLGGWAVWWLTRRLSAGAIVQGAAGLTVLLLSVLTWRQCTIWRDSLSLWEHAGSIYPSGHLIQRNWGTAFTAIGDHNAALAHYQEAARLAPESPEAHNNVGLALIQLGLPAKAEAPLRRALELRPRHGSAHYNLANALVQLGRLREAVDHYRLALDYRPDLVGARVNLANTLNRLGRKSDAEEEWAKAVEENPAMASAYGNWAVALMDQRRYAEAADVLRRGVGHCPAEAQLRLQWIWLLAAAPDEKVRDGKQALAQAERLNRAAGRRDAAYVDALAAACAEAGRFDDAVTHAEQAAELAALSGNRNLVRQIESRVRNYRLKRPFRLPGPPVSRGPSNHTR